MTFIKFIKADEKKQKHLKKIQAQDLSSLLPDELSNVLKHIQKEDQERFVRYLRGIIAKKLPQENTKKRLKNWFENGSYYRSFGPPLHIRRLTIEAEKIIKMKVRLEKMKLKEKSKKTSQNKGIQKADSTILIDNKIEEHTKRMIAIAHEIYMEVSIG